MLNYINCLSLFALPSQNAMVIAANGWQATPVGAPVDLSMSDVIAKRLGYDGTAQAVYHDETLKLTKRVAKYYPDTTSMVSPSFTNTDVALSDTIYSTDRVYGCLNGSTQVSPKPTAAWVMPYRLVVGDTVHWEMVAFHRDGRNNRQVACVRVRAVDSSNSANVTPWQTVSTTAISTLCEDVNPVEVFKGDLTISGLPDNILFHLEAEVYPWIGTAASVLSTVGETSARKFGPRHFTRDTARAANPPIVYVASTGNDTTGVCSTSDATAAATPCLTIHGAITKAIATTAVTGGKVDGLRIRIADTVTMGTHNSAIHRNQSSGAIVIERGTGTARASAIVQQPVGFNLGGSGYLNPLLTSAAVVFYDVTVQRTGVGQAFVGATGILHNFQLWNVNFDNANVAGVWVGGGGSSTLRIYGCTWSNYNGNLSYSASLTIPLLRGLVTPTAVVEGTCVIGSRVLGLGSRPDPENGVIMVRNTMSGGNGLGIAVDTSTVGQTITGVVVTHNLFEWTGTTNTTAFRLSADNGNGNIVGAIVSHNVCTGYGLYGRWNMLYDESTGTNRRSHKHNRIVGNIVAQLNTKSAVFVAVNQSNPSEAPNRHGNWPFAHGAGSWGNFAMFSTQAPSSESQIYPGIGSFIGPSTTVRSDPLFVAYAGAGGSGGVPSAGAGGGDYHLQAGSPCKNIVPVAAFGFDFAGTARGAGTQDAGLYA